MQRKILIVSPIPTHPKKGGNRARVYNFLRTLEQLGHDFVFLHVRQMKGDDSAMRECWGERYQSCDYSQPFFAYSAITRWLRQGLGMSYNYQIDEWYDTQLNVKVAELHQQHKFNVVVAEYVFFSKVFDCFNDNVLKVIDTHDLFTDRHQRYLKNGQKPRWFSTNVMEEAKGLNRADIVIGIQEKESVELAKMTNKTVITIGHLIDVVQPQSRTWSQVKILFLASDNPINVHAIDNFLIDIWPTLKRELPNLCLILAGKVCDKVENSPAGVEKLGMVEDIEQLYRDVDAVINPVLFGTGLNIKSIEALGFAKPLVTTEKGADGLDKGFNEAFLVVEAINDWVRQLRELENNPEKYLKVCTDAHEFAKQWNKVQVAALEDMLSIDTHESKNLIN